MYHDTQNFSNITAIETRRKLHVHMKLKAHGRVKYFVTINDFVINVNELTFEFDLMDSVNFVIELLDFDEGSSGVEIEYFGINGKEILPKYQHLASDGKCYIDKLGKWSINIPSHFYAWYQTISGESEILNIDVL